MLGKRQQDLRIVYKTPEGYKFSNTFFKAWLLDRETI